MAFNLPDIRTKVDAFLQDDASFITEAERIEAIDQAIRQVSHDRPDRAVKAITGDTTQDYDIEGEGFEKGFSDMKEVEFPAAENPPQFLERNDDWFIYEDPTKSAGAQLRLRFITVTPKTSESIRATFTRSHAVTETTSTLNLTSFGATIYKALVFLYRALAARFAETTGLPTIEADAVDYAGRSQNFLFLAERWENQYKQIIGFDGEELTAAQALDEVDIRFAHGEDLLFHTSRTR